MGELNPFQRPIACDLTVFQPDERQHHTARSQELFSRCFAVRDLPDGLAFLFSAEDVIWQTIVAWVAKERRCCPFLSFEVIVPPSGGPVELRLRGPQGTKELLRRELDARRNSQAGS